MINIICIGLGGAAGAILRYLVGLAVVFPYGTMLVNILGCLLMGICFSYLSNVNETIKLAIMTGVLGGFTTFSAFSLDVLQLLQSNQILYALCYIAVTIILCLLAVYIGYKL